jgi:hypothetical protein
VSDSLSQVQVLIFKSSQVAAKLARIASVRPPRSDPKKIQFFRVCGAPHTRSNWLHVGGDGGLKTTSVLLSVCASATRHCLNPWSYLRDVLDQLACRPSNADVGDILPDAWAICHAQID